MKRNNTIFSYAEQIFMVFGFTVLCLVVFVRLFGISAQEISTIYELGEEGLTVGTLLQFFLVSVLSVTFRYVFFSEKLIRHIPSGVRIAGMFAAIVIMIGVFAYFFGWFPVGEWKAWAMFFICFGICAIVSIVVSVLKERQENRKMEEALERLKQK